MQKFTTHSGIAVPLFEANIDTDQIIPKQFLKSIKRTGFGANLFNDWRFLPDGSSNPEFVLNNLRYQDASILLTGKNFGCGSSREHAPWALEDYGFRVVIAPSFADIFYNNCFKIGLLPIILTEEKVAELVKNAETHDGYSLNIDIVAQTVSDNDGFNAQFPVDEFRKYCLLNGFDDIGLTLQHADRISEYEKSRATWLNL